MKLGLVRPKNDYYYALILSNTTGISLWSTGSFSHYWETDIGITDIGIIDLTTSAKFSLCQ